MSKILSSTNFRKMLIIFFLFVLFRCSIESMNIPASGWGEMNNILSRISAPVFPDKDFNIINYGAKPDGEFDNQEIINKTIIECSANGGGRIVIPKGEYFCAGTINLKSNVNFHLEEGAVIKFSTNPDDYLPVVLTRWEGIECYNYSPLIYAFEQENIAVTGKGILHGQGANENWWSWKGKKEYGWNKGMPSQLDSLGRPLLMKMSSENTSVEKRVFGKGSYLRPNFIQPFRCKNVLIEGVTFLDSPMWFIHPVESQNISIIDVTVKGLGPNNDGLDPESCKDVLIKGCDFQTGDDCIAIKSGRNNDGRRIAIPSENIVIQNCKMKDGHGGVVIGSEISGDCRNVFAENCEMDSPNLDRAIRIKTNSYRGGIIENIFVRNIKVGEVSEAVLKINMKYEPDEGSDGKFLPVIKNINLQNITSKKSKYGLYLIGLENSKIKNVIIDTCNFENVKSGNAISDSEELSFEEFFINNEKQKMID